MPLTFAHPLAVVPFRRTRLVFPALVVGSMVPDLPHFMPFIWSYETSHSILGSLLCSVTAGMLILGIWETLLFPALDSTVPDRLRRWPPPRRRPESWWLRAIPSLVVGAWTHLLWDVFTHPGTVVTTSAPFVHQSFLSIPFLAWMQILHSIAGLLIIAWLVVRWWRRSDPAASRQTPARLPRGGHAWSKTRDRQVLWGLPLLVGAGTALPELTRLLAVPVLLPRPYGLAIFADGGGAALLTLVLVSLAWMMTVHDRGAVRG